MTLVKLGDAESTTILIDINIRSDADDPASSTRDVAKDLRARLKTDDKSRPYVDVFLLSHPDQDHCRGLRRHFYLGPLGDYPDDNLPQDQKRIVIREIWSSPIVFRRASKNHTLCDDAKAFNTEAKRRVRVNKENGFITADGDRITVLGEDADGKTDDLAPILWTTGNKSASIRGRDFSAHFTGHLLAPIKADDDAELEANLSKNHSSVIINFMFASGALTPDGVKFLTGGDAEVLIWTKLWEKYKDTPEVLTYDVMQTPHHCSWHSLSYDSWSEKKEKAKVEQDARRALGQARAGAVIVASCKPIRDDDVDPPCIRAKREYEDMLKASAGTLICTDEYPSENSPEPYVLTVTADGAARPSKSQAAAKLGAAASVAREPMPHG
ncbi:metallohydrolase [Massilia sp. SR12]